MISPPTERANRFGILSRSLAAFSAAEREGMENGLGELKRRLEQLDENF
jgi:hypothetical protein